MPLSLIQMDFARICNQTTKMRDCNSPYPWAIYPQFSSTQFIYTQFLGSNHLFSSSKNLHQKSHNPTFLSFLQLFLFPNQVDKRYPRRNVLEWTEAVHNVFPWSTFAWDTAKCDFSATVKLETRDGPNPELENLSLDWWKLFQNVTNFDHKNTW